MPEPTEVSIDDVLSGTDLGLTSPPAAEAADGAAPAQTSQAKDGGTPGASVPQGTSATGAAAAEPNDFDLIPELKAAMTGSPAPGSTEEGGGDGTGEGEGAVTLSDAQKAELAACKTPEELEAKFNKMVHDVTSQWAQKKGQTYKKRAEEAELQAKVATNAIELLKSMGFNPQQIPPQGQPPPPPVAKTPEETAYSEAVAALQACDGYENRDEWHRLNEDMLNKRDALTASRILSKIKSESQKEIEAIQQNKAEVEEWSRVDQHMAETRVGSLTSPIPWTYCRAIFAQMKKANPKIINKLPAEGSAEDVVDVIESIVAKAHPEVYKKCLGVVLSKQGDELTRKMAAGAAPSGNGPSGDGGGKLSEEDVTIGIIQGMDPKWVPPK